MTEPRHPVPRMPEHVWVDVTGVFGPHRCAGIVTEWRRQTAPPHRLEGLVAYAEADAHGWQVVTRWMLREHLQPLK